MCNNLNWCRCLWCSHSTKICCLFLIILYQILAVDFQCVKFLHSFLNLLLQVTFTLFRGAQRHWGFGAKRIQTHHPAYCCFHTNHLPCRSVCAPYWSQTLRAPPCYSVSYQEHFFNSTFNQPGLKSPQTTIWHQPNYSTVMEQSGVIWYKQWISKAVSWVQWK